MRTKAIETATILLALTLIASSILIPAEPAFADGYGTWWYDAQLGGTRYWVNLDLEPGISVGGPLDEDLHDAWLNAIYVLNATTGLPATDWTVTARAALQAQNRAIMAGDSQWTYHLYGSEYYKTVSGLVDSEGQLFEVILPSAISDAYEHILLYGRAGFNLTSRSFRRKLYKEVVRGIVFPALRDASENPNLEQLQRIEEEFDRDLGPLLLDAKAEAASAGFSPGKTAWAVQVVGFFAEHAGLYLAKAGKSVEFVEAFVHFMDGLELGLSAREAQTGFNALTAENSLQVAYMQAVGAERLAALRHWVDDPHVQIDPALREAVLELCGELDVLDSAAWYETARAMFGDHPVANTMEVLDLVDLIAGLVSNIPVVNTVSFIYKGIRVVYGAVSWMLLRDERIMVAGLYATIEDRIRWELMQYTSTLPPLEDTERCLILSNTRLYASHAFFDVMLVRSDWWDVFWWWVWPGNSSSEVEAALLNESNARWNAFVLTLPRVYWAYEDASWIVDMLNIPPTGSSSTLSEAAISPGNQGYPTTPFSFEVRYTDVDNDPPEFVRVVVDGSQYSMSSPDTTYTDGAVFATGQTSFQPGLHSYTLEAKAIDEDFVTDLGPYSFTVVDPQASGIVVTANPPSVEVGQKSVIEATLTGEDGYPQEGETLHYRSNGFAGAFTDCTTHQGTSYATTDASGRAQLCFAPSTAGTATLSATADNGVSGQTQLFVSWPSDNDILLGLSYYTSTDTQTVYEVTARYVDALGDPIGIEDLTIATTFGELSLNSGGPWPSGSSVVATTDGISGIATAYLRATSEGEAVVSATGPCGATKAMSTYLRVGPLPVLTTPAVQIQENMVHGIDWHGNRLVSLGGYGLKLWDTDTWSDVPVATYTGEYLSGDACGVEFSRDGSMIAAAAEWEWLYILASTNLSLLHRHAVPGPYMDVSWSLGDTYVVNTDYRNTEWNSKRWRVADGALSGGTQMHSDDVNSAAYSPNGSWVAETDDAGYMQLNTSTLGYMNKVYAASQAGKKAYGLAWSPDSTKIAVTTKNETVIYNTNLGEVRRLAAVGGGAYVYAVDWSPDGSMLATFGGQANVQLWDADSGAYLTGLAYGSGAYCDASLVWDPTSQYVAFADGGSIKVYAPFDMTGPTVGISSPEDGYQTAATHVTVSGQVTDDFVVRSATVSVNTGPSEALTLDGNGLFSHDVALSVGVNEITVRGEDGTGNASTASVTVHRPADLDPPLVLSTDVAPDSAVFCSAFTVQTELADVSGVDPSTVTAYLQHPDGVNVASLPLFDDGTHDDAMAGDGVLTGTWDSCVAVDEGTYYVDVEASDTEGNNVYANNVATFEVFDLPEITVVGHIPMEPTDSEPATVTAEIMDASPIGSVVLQYSVNGGGTWLSASMVHTGGVTWEGTIPELDAGQVTFRVNATDTHLHTGTSAEHTYMVRDATAPVFFGWQESPVDLTEDSVGPFVVTLTVADSGGSGLEGQTPQFDYHLSSGAYDGFQNMTNVSGNTWSYTVPAQDWEVVRGQELRYKARCADVAGNLGVSTEPVEVIESINDPPEIVAFNPGDLSPSVTPPDCIQFSVAAQDADGDPLGYDWRVDGVSASSSSEYSYCPGSEDAGDHSVIAIVDDGQATALKAWTVTVGSRYDFDSDCDIDVVDIMAAASRWGCESGDDCYDSQYDLDDDGDVDVLDIMTVAGRWGCQCGDECYSDTTSAASGAQLPLVIGPVEVRVDPDTSTVAPGDTFMVVVQIEDAVDVGGFQFEMSFDPSVIRIEDIALYDFLVSTRRRVSMLGPVIDNGTGTVTFGGFSFGDRSGPDGDGELAAITLRAQAAGSSPLTLESAQIVNTVGRAQRATLDSASVTVGFGQRTYLPLIVV